MNRTIKAVIAALILALAAGFATMYLPNFHASAMLLYRRAAHFAGLVAAELVEDGREAAKRGDYPTAMRILRPLADQGDAAAQFYLGLMYASGQGVPQDYAVAVSWYRKAADQGLAKAQNNLGFMYENEHGVPQDYAVAVSWYRKAADQGYPSAQNHLGFMYENGYGVPQDYAVAMSWYQKAADQGLASAQGSVGLMYANGRGGVSQDYAAAVSWYQKAADQGDAWAQRLLGITYSSKGVPQDDVLAYKWLNLAAAAGDNIADIILDSVAEKMAPAQIAEAQTAAANWTRRAAEQGLDSAQNNLGNLYAGGQGSRKTTPLRRAGIERRPSKASRKLKIVSDPCTLTATVSRKTTPLR